MGKPLDDLAAFRSLIESDDAVKALRSQRVPAPVAATGAPSMIRERPAKSDADLGIDPGVVQPSFVDSMKVHQTAGMSPTQREDRLRTDAGPLADDWIAQNIVAGIPAAGAGAVAGAAARALVPASQGAGRLAGAASTMIPRVAQGATEGATASAGLGGDPALGAGVGAAVPFAGMALRAAATGAPERIAQRVTQKVSKGAGPSTRAHLYDIGPGDVSSVAREFKLVGGGPQAIQDGLNKVSAEMQAPYARVHQGGVVPQETVSKALDALEQDWGRTQATQPFAADVAKLRTSMESQYIDHGGPTARQLQDEITAFNKSAFGGNYANPSVGKSIERRVSGALKGALNEHLDTVAGTAPDAASAVATIKALNKKMEVLKALEPAIKKQAVDKMLPPAATFPQKKSMLVGAAKGIAAGADHVRNWAGEASASLGSQTLSEPVSAAVAAGDHRKAIDLTMQEVYGD